MLGCNDTPIRTLTKLLDKLVLRVDDEGRVQCLEGVSLHGSIGILDGSQESRIGESLAEEIYTWCTTRTRRETRSIMRFPYTARPFLEGSSDGVKEGPGDDSSPPTL